MTSQQTTVEEAAQKLPRVEGYLASDPGNLDLLTMAIDLSLAVGDPGRARGHADAALARYPEDAFFRLRMATVLMAQHEWSLAAAQLEAVLRNHAEVGIAYNLAYCYTWQGRHRAAYDCLAPYGATAPLAPLAVTLLVRALHHLGEFEQATALVQAEMARCQADPAFLGAASMLYFDNGQAEESARLSALALEHGARPVEALVVAASLALGRTDADLATAMFNEVLAKNPTEGRSWSGLGLASMLKRDLPAAAQQLEQAVKYLPGHVGTWHILGWCKILSQDLDGALAVFLKAIEMDRNFGDSHGGLATVQALKGERLLAEESIKRGLGLDPRSLSARFAQMVLSGKVSDPATFRALCSRMLSSHKGPFGESLDALLDQYEAR
jgi:tetratricopeptide (TPR) repeat protein